jgi:hypothetical protein
LKAEALKTIREIKEFHPLVGAQGDAIIEA